MREWRPILDFLLLLAAATIPSPARAEILILTPDRALRATEVSIRDDAIVVALPDDDEEMTLPASDVQVMFFEPRPILTAARDWLCLRDGQRLSGDLIRIDAAQLQLRVAGGSEVAVAPTQLAAVAFDAGAPPAAAPPEAGVRVISRNGDVLDVPSVHWTPGGLRAEIDPDLDPLVLPLETISALLWPASAQAAAPPAQDAAATHWLVDLRTGDRSRGRISDWNAHRFVLVDDTGQTRIPRRELQAIWSVRQQITLLETLVVPPDASTGRPSWRLHRDGLGGPLRIGSRGHTSGLGLRGPVEVEVAVPAGAVWFIALAGPDADAAPAARITMEIRVDGVSRWHRTDLRPGDEPQRLAVEVKDARRLILRIAPSGDNPTGCLGDFVDACFVH